MINPIALEALTKNQRQLDQDGVEVGVSRQALDELIAEFNKIDAPPGWLTLADFLDPETAIDDRVLRAIHLDLETRGRKNADFMVTVHHRNIVLSAAARAVRKTPAADRISHLEARLEASEAKATRLRDEPAEQITDAVLGWMVERGFLDADNEYSPQDVLAVLNDLVAEDH
jgi:hypothetical protein